MHTQPPHRPKPNPDRLAGWARLWLSCIATLLTCAAHLLPPAHRRRLPLLNLPRTMLAGFVTRLILLCALTSATAPSKTAAPQPGELRAILRAGMRKHLKNAHGALDLARIAHTCANPDAAIADMIAALERRLTKRTPILAREIRDMFASLVAFAGETASACDTS